MVTSQSQVFLLARYQCYAIWPFAVQSSQTHWFLCDWYSSYCMEWATRTATLDLCAQEHAASEGWRGRQRHGRSNASWKSATWLRWGLTANNTYDRPLPYSSCEFTRVATSDWNIGCGTERRIWRNTQDGETTRRSFSEHESTSPDWRQYVVWGRGQMTTRKQLYHRSSVCRWGVDVVADQSCNHIIPCMMSCCLLADYAMEPLSQWFA